jgi:uncharacterized protein
LEFDWDAQKAKISLRKPDVTFQEASSVFGDALAITFQDPDHSTTENRYLTFGLSQSGRLLVVSHTNRSDKIRIISSRLMDRKERIIYEEG